MSDNVNNNKNGNIRNNLKVIVDKQASDSNLDDGIGSLPITPTDIGKNKNLSVSRLEKNKNKMEGSL